MTGLRRLPLVPTSLEGEWFGSWIDVLGSRLLLPGRSRWEALGINVLREHISFGRLHHLSKDEIAAVTMTTGLDPAEVSNMLMIPFYDAAIERAPDFDDSERMGIWLAKHQLGRSRAAACPSCLRQTVAAAWRLPLSMICLRHEEYLVSSCPRQQCRRPLFYPLAGKEFHPALRAAVGNPPRNWIPRVIDLDLVGQTGLREPQQWCQPVRLSGVTQDFCLSPHVTVASRPARDQALLGLQKLMDVLSRKPGTPTVTWFLVTRMALERSAESPRPLRRDWRDTDGALMPPDEVTVDAMAEWSATVQRQSEVEAEGHQRRGRRGVPFTTEQTAALLRAAIEREGLDTFLKSPAFGSSTT